MQKKYEQYKEILKDTYSVKHKISTETENPFYHMHEEFEVCLLLSDHLTCFIDNNSFQVGKNTLLLVNKMNLHFVHQNHPGSLFERYTLYFKPEMIDVSTENTELLKCFYYRPYIDACILPLTEENAEKLISLLNKAITTSENLKGYGEDLYPKLIISEVLLNINLWYQDFHNFNYEKENKEFNQIFPIITYIQNHYSEEITLDLLAKKFFITKPVLCQSFRKATGMTSNQYLIHCRLTQAKNLLSRELCSVETVCGMVGFHNMPHFSRTFKEHFGISPKKYQQMFHRTL